MKNNDKIESEIMEILVCILMILVLCDCSINQKGKQKKEQ
jgi:hypothetical protein